VKLALFDPLDSPPDAWPEGCDTERAYIEGIARAGIAAMVSNVRTRWFALRAGDRVFPLTVNDGEVGDSYVCLPHSAYVLYAREELELVGIGRLRPLLRGLIRVLDRLLRVAGINRIVHIDNWLLSTNLHGDWRGEDVGIMREYLVSRFPGHIIAIRSVDAWSNPALEAALCMDRWRLMPSRQIWVTDDLAQDWSRRNSVLNDFRTLRRSGLRVEELTSMSESDAMRIADLYRQLYVDKYSTLNPVFTSDYIRMTHAAGMIRYRVARANDGRIMAVGGLFARAGVATAPIVGYDVQRSPSEGLYRIACLLFCVPAMAAGLRLNGSAGAPEFKRVRGARPEIESMAVSTSHLSLFRRMALRGLEMLLWYLVVPMMRRLQL
jgi:hypothetical protein